MFCLNRIFGFGDCLITFLGKKVVALWGTVLLLDWEDLEANVQDQVGALGSEHGQRTPPWARGHRCLFFGNYSILVACKGRVEGCRSGLSRRCRLQIFPQRPESLPKTLYDQGSQYQIKYYCDNMHLFILLMFCLCSTSWPCCCQEQIRNI